MVCYAGEIRAGEADMDHTVAIQNLQPGTTYFYSIPSSNGTTASPVLNFTTAQAPGANKEFTIAVLNDMGYTNAQGTYKYLNQAADDGIAFAWHGQFPNIVSSLAR